MSSRRRVLARAFATAASVLPIAAGLVAPGAPAYAAPPAPPPPAVHAMGGVIAPTRAPARALSPSAVAALPNSVDLSRFDPPVGNQGGVQSCQAWSAAHLRDWYAKRDGYYPGGATDGLGGFAPMYTYAQYAKGVNMGETLEGQFALQMAQGIDTRADYTQGDYDYTTQPTPAETANAGNYRISGYGSWGNPGGTGMQSNIESALASGNPVVVAFPVFPEYEAAGGGSPWLISTPTPRETSSGNHMNFASRYDQNGLWVQNQWGTNWGNNGYAELSWSFVNQYVQEYATIAPITPPRTSAVTSWVDSTYEHVVYLSSDGHARELHSRLGTGSWSQTDLTSVTGAPLAAVGSALTSWADPSYEHVVFLSMDGHVHELYLQLATGSWSQGDLTAVTAAPAAVTGSPLTSWVDSSYQHVVYLSNLGHVEELYMRLGTGSWGQGDLTWVTNAPAASLSSALTSRVDSSYQHVVFLSGDGHARDLYMALGTGSWRRGDLTWVTGAPTAATGSALTSWVDSSAEHVVYLSGDGHAHELYIGLGTGPWRQGDLMTWSTGAPPAVAGSALTSWADPGYKHIVFLSGEGHVHELYGLLPTGSWSQGDLTSVTGVPVAAVGSALTSWVDTSYQHVVFLSSDGHAHQLYMRLGTGSWGQSDLTLMTGAPPAATGLPR